MSVAIIYQCITWLMHICTQYVLSCSYTTHYCAPICYVVQLATNQPVVTTTEYFTSTNEGEQTFSPPRWLSPPPRSAQDESSRPNNLDSALPKDLFIAAEEEEEDPNHAWLEQQMMYESDDDELFNL